LLDFSGALLGRFLLITWGALRLLEILFWAMTSKPLPVHGHFRAASGRWSYSCACSD